MTMANSYTQINVQFVFVVKFREGLIDYKWETDLYKYISGIVDNNGHKLLQINGMPDHIHILIGMRPVQSVSDLAKQIKSASAIWINESGFLKSNFKWQKGYGAFSYSNTDAPNVINYIKNQKEHHKINVFYDEYLDLLKSFGVDYDEIYLFKDPE